MELVFTYCVLLLTFSVKSDVFVYSYEANMTPSTVSVPVRPDEHVTWRQCDDKLYPFSGRFITSLPDYDAKRLDLRFCNITEVKQDQFLGLPNLEYIEAYANNMINIHPAAFKPVPNLTTLDLTNNRFTAVPVLDEHSLPKLKWLKLFDNLISGLYNPRTFFSCVKLEDLALSNNVIEYIHPEVFKPLTVLRFLTLSDNKITFLYDSMFVQNSNLQWLLLRDNKLSSLPVGFISKFKCEVYHRIELSGNPWDCSCWLEIIAELKQVKSGFCYSDFIISFDEDKPVCVFSGSSKCHRYEPAKLLPASSSSQSYNVVRKSWSWGLCMAFLYCKFLL